METSFNLISAIQLRVQMHDELQFYTGAIVIGVIVVSAILMAVIPALYDTYCSRHGLKPLPHEVEQAQHILHLYHRGEK